MSETSPEASAATAEGAPEPKNFVARLSDGIIVKRRIVRQRACDEPMGKKGKICAGHLKRWYGYGEEVVAQFGRDAEVYRCERCQILFLPNENETARTGTLAY